MIPTPNKVLLITGGASGIGAATARLAGRQGYALALNYRSREQEAGRLVEELRGAGARAVAIAADVREPVEVARLYATVDREFGRLDAVVNSAGVGLRPIRVEELDAAATLGLLQTNVLGLMLSCREAARRLSRARGGPGGVIVNVSSMAATIGGRPGSSVYAATKAAVDCFSIGFAKEVAREGIRVLSLRPGFTRTDMTGPMLADPEVARNISGSIPLGRPATAEEVARPIAWLLSDEASFMTGTCIDVSGGGFLIGSQPD